MAQKMQHTSIIVKLKSVYSVHLKKYKNGIKQKKHGNKCIITKLKKSIGILSTKINALISKCYLF